MRSISFLLIAAALTAAGCDEASQASAQPADQAGSPGIEPLIAGELVDGILWQQPVTGFWRLHPDSNVGTVPTPGSRVEVYESFILVTSPDGVTELSLHGWYTNLQFRRDPQ